MADVARRPAESTSDGLPAWHSASTASASQPAAVARTLSAFLTEFRSQFKGDKAGPLDIHKLLEIFLATCNAVASLHSRGVVHGNVSGQTIMVSDHGQVSLDESGGRSQE